MSEFALQPGETVVRKNIYAVWFKSTFNAKTGTLILTNRRLVFDVDAFLLYEIMLDLILKLFFPSLSGSGVKFDLPLQEIVDISKGSFGLSTVLVLGYGEGKKTKFTVGKEKDYLEWETAIRLARSGVSRVA